ncbi:MAG: tetratricopeptide repeat protein [Candidatus Obscuribacterales bacterium]|nr:tetratricopeptide repeat protein [Candidatus Obscuribacterales bacterium]
MNSQMKVDLEMFIEDGRKARERGDLANAEQIYATAFSLAKDAGAFMNQQVCQLLFELGELYAEQEDYRAAETVFRKTIAILEIIDGVDNLDTAILVKRMSELCRLRGNPIEAVRLRHRAEKLLKPTRRRLERIFSLAASSAVGEV